MVSPLKEYESSSVIAQQIVRSDENTLKEKAWLLGILCAGGNIYQSQFGLKSQDSEVISRFSQIASARYQVNAPIMKGGTRLRITSKHFTDEFKPLKTNEWPRHLNELYSWLYEDTTLVAAFLGGYFDLRGSVSDPRSRHSGYSVLFSLSKPSATDELVAQLKLIGVNNTRQVFHHKEVVGVTVGQLQELNIFANQVHSTVLSKEALLEMYRQFVEPVPQNKYQQAYTVVCKLVERDQLTIDELVDHPDVQRFGLERRRISSWVTGDANPNRNRRYINLSREFTKKDVLEIVKDMLGIDSRDLLVQRLINTILKIQQPPENYQRIAMAICEAHYTEGHARRYLQSLREKVQAATTNQARNQELLIERTIELEALIDQLYECSDLPGLKGVLKKLEVAFKKYNNRDEIIPIV